MIRDFYLNMKLIGTSLETYVKGVEIIIHKIHIGSILEIPIRRLNYTQGKPIGFKNFKHFVSINSIVINPVEKMKVTFRTTHLKPKDRILHYHIMRVLFLRIINDYYVTREDIVKLWHQISGIRIIFIHYFYCFFLSLFSHFSFHFYVLCFGLLFLCIPSSNMFYRRSKEIFERNTKNRAKTIFLHYIFQSHITGVRNAHYGP